MGILDVYAYKKKTTTMRGAKWYLQDFQVGDISKLCWNTSSKIVVIQITVIFRISHGMSLLKAKSYQASTVNNYKLASNCTYKFLKAGKQPSFRVSSLKVPTKWLLPTSLWKQNLAMGLITSKNKISALLKDFLIKRKIYRWRRFGKLHNPGGIRPAKRFSCR